MLRDLQKRYRDWRLVALRQDAFSDHVLNPFHKSLFRPSLLSSFTQDASGTQMPPGLMYDNVITDQRKALLNPKYGFFTSGKN